MNEVCRCKAERLFQQILNLPPDERMPRFEACGAEPEVRAEVEALLAGMACEQFTSLQAADLLDETDADLVGASIGPYRLLEPIGEGGFGVVYMAQQEVPVRRKDGGGTERGRPFFVMELVSGTPITDYCDEHRLSTKQRVRLFAQVCRAVQHAHQKGVIHRDIKPSNVLVTLHDGVPVPKIIDFGIAKAIHEPLTDGPLFTGLRQFLGTPEYVSPEQAEMGGLDVDTRTDLYSLGILLYELLTGTTPFDSQTLRNASYTEILRTIREQPPVTPSRRLSALGPDLQRVASLRQAGIHGLGRLIRGDLDWIVTKAMEKDRTSRYETAAALAVDVESYLENRPVSAGPPGVLHRCRKMFGRHKTAVGVAAAFLFLVVGFGVWMGVLYTRAEHAHRTAEANLIRAQQAEDRAKIESGFMHELLTSVAPANAQGREAGVRYVLDEASRRIEEGWLESQPEVQAAVRLTIGKTYYDLGLRAAADPHIRAGEKTYERLLGDEHPDTLRARRWLGQLLHAQGRTAEAGALLCRTGDTQARVLGPEHPETLRTRSAHAITMWYTDGSARAERIHRDTLGIQRRVLGNEHVDTLRSVVSLGTVLQHQGDFEGAEALLREGLEIQRRVWGDEHPDTSRAMNNLGLALKKQGKYAEAEALFRRSLELDRRVLGDGHPTTRIPLNNLWGVLRAQGKWDELESCVADEIGRLKRAAARPDADADVLNSCAWLLLTCEPIHLRDPRAALLAAERAVELNEAPPGDHWDTLAKAYGATGDIDRALETQRKAVAAARSVGTGNLPELEQRLIDYLWEKGDYSGAGGVYGDILVRRSPETNVGNSAVADSIFSLAQEASGHGESARAERLLRTCVAVQKETKSVTQRRVAETVALLGSVLAAQGMFDEAERMLLDAHASMSAHSESGASNADLVIAQIVDLYKAWDKPEEAAGWRSKLP
jgi:tetratricopeptide (TPR) repeat protein